MQQENKPIVVERVFDAPPELVWRALTDKDMMKEWYFDLAEFRPEVGFRFEFLAGPPDKKKYLHVCEVTDVVPGQRLAYSWRYDGYGGISQVTFELLPEGTGTHLKFTHEGVETLAAEHADFAVKNFEDGWNHIVGTALKEFLERRRVRS